MISPALKNVPVSSLVPYERNARTHSATQVEQIARSITEFGFTNPLLVDEQSRIIAGHGRLMAAQSLGMVARLAELDPRYCDVIVARYEQFTGRKAKLEPHD